LSTHGQYDKDQGKKICIDLLFDSIIQCPKGFVVDAKSLAVDDRAYRVYGFEECLDEARKAREVSGRSRNRERYM
jgi:hypothetical protein